MGEHDKCEPLGRRLQAADRGPLGGRRGSNARKVFVTRQPPKSGGHN